MSSRSESDDDFDDAGPWDFDVRFTIERPLVGSNDPSDYVFGIEGEIIPRVEEGTSKPVGWISARVVQADRVINENAASLFDVCDGEDQQLHDAASSVYDFDESSIREDVSDGCAGSTVLFIDTVRIVPSFRGRGLGLLAALRTIETFSHGLALAVLKPFPLQFSSDRELRPRESNTGVEPMSYAGLATDEKAAFAKLRRYWKRIGFVRIPKHPEFYALDLQQRLPDYESLIAKLAARTTN